MIKNISNLGDAALYCDFGKEVNKDINTQVIKYFKTIQKKNIVGVNNITPSYNKLIISFDLKKINFNKLKKIIYNIEIIKGDNIQNKNYTNLLVTTGLHDSQVQYWEPAKWVAKLRQYHKGDNLILLHTNMDTGHSGSSGRFEALKEVAMEYAFLFMLEGITK